MDKLAVLNTNKTFLITSLLISLGSNIAFIVLFIMYSGEEADNVSCATLINWDKGLYISLIILTAATFIKTCYELSALPETPKSGLYGTAYCLNTMAGLSCFVCWIGIQAVYFNLEVSGVCNNLGKLNLAYIIFNYAMIGVAFLMCFFMCFCAAMFMASATNQVQNQAQAEYNKQLNDGE